MGKYMIIIVTKKVPPKTDCNTTRVSGGHGKQANLSWREGGRPEQDFHAST